MEALASTVMSGAASGSWCRTIVADSSGAPRRYLGGVALSFGVGVGYALLGATMVASTTADPYQPSPGMAALADVFIWVLLGLIFLPLALGGIFYWALRTRGVGPAPGCASIFLSAVSGMALTFVVGFASSTPTPPRLHGGWVESRPAGYSVHLASPGDCSSHPAMHFAPGADGAYVPTAGCCSIVWWSEGRSDAAEWSDPGPVELHQPKGSPTQWDDLDGFADYLAGADGPVGGAFTRTEIVVEAGRAIRLDDERTRPSSAYLFTDGTRYYSVACSDPDPPQDHWLSMAETFAFLPAEE